MEKNLKIIWLNFIFAGLLIFYATSAIAISDSEPTLQKILKTGFLFLGYQSQYSVGFEDYLTTPTQNRRKISSGQIWQKAEKERIERRDQFEITEIKKDQKRYILKPTADEWEAQIISDNYSPDELQKEYALNLIDQGEIFVITGQINKPKSSNMPDQIKLIIDKKTSLITEKQSSWSNGKQQNEIISYFKKHRVNLIHKITVTQSDQVYERVYFDYQFKHNLSDDEFDLDKIKLKRNGKDTLGKTK